LGDHEAREREKMALKLENELLRFEGRFPGVRRKALPNGG
jgi:stringent starvation protein B